MSRLAAKMQSDLWPGATVSHLGFPFSLLLLQPIPTAAEVTADLTCLSAYSLCAYANCTYSGDYNAIPYYNGQKTSGPAYVANCGCQPVLPSQAPAGSPYNSGSSVGILEKVRGGAGGERMALPPLPVPRWLPLQHRLLCRHPIEGEGGGA